MVNAVRKTNRRKYYNNSLSIIKVNFFMIIQGMARRNESLETNAFADKIYHPSGQRTHTDNVCSLINHQSLRPVYACHNLLFLIFIRITITK